MMKKIHDCGVPYTGSWLLSADDPGDKYRLRCILGGSFMEDLAG
jgi:hypothetical protein